MQRSRRLSWCAAAIAVTLFGCGRDGPAPLTPSPTGPPDSLPSPGPVPAPGPVPGALRRISGNEQKGLLGETVDDPLVAMVTDHRGIGIAGVPVTWTFHDAKSSICLLNEYYYYCAGGSRVVPTDAEGRSAVRAKPGAFDLSVVTAMVTTQPALSVSFTMNVIGVLIRADPLFDCGLDNDPVRFTGHEGTSHTAVPVGTPVEFEFSEWLSPGCLARIVTTSAPTGDQGFDTGNLGPGQRFRFVPTVAGTWEFRDKFSGGVGWLTAGPWPTFPSFPPLSRPGTVYNEMLRQYSNGPNGYSATRFVLFDDGTFQLQFSTQPHGWFAYDGSYSLLAATIALAFTGGAPAGKWEATASVSGDTITVNYNQLMQLDDFINGRYIRAR